MPYCDFSCPNVDQHFHSQNLLFILCIRPSNTQGEVKWNPWNLLMLGLGKFLAKSETLSCLRHPTFPQKTKKLLLSSSLFLYSLSLREGWHYNHFPPPIHHQNFLSALEVTYTQVWMWYNIGIISSSLLIYTQKNRVNKGHKLPPPVSIRVKSALEATYTQVWYIYGIVSSSPSDFHSEKIGLIRVRNYLPCQF